MQRNPVVGLLVLAILSVGGCAKNDDVLMSRPIKRTWGNGNERYFTSTRRAAAPRILPKTFFAAGRLFESQGLIGQAIVQYRKAIAADHDYAAAHYRMGVLLSSIEQHEEAVAALTRAAQLEPDNALVRNDLGFELFHSEAWNQAEQELRRAVALKPDFARAHVNLGMVLSRLGRFDDALASFRVVLPEEAAYYNLGLMYRGQGRYVEAEKAFRHTLESNPDFTAASRQLDTLAVYLEPTPPVEKSGTPWQPPPTPTRFATREFKQESEPDLKRKPREAAAPITDEDSFLGPPDPHASRPMKSAAASGIAAEPVENLEDWGGLATILEELLLTAEKQSHIEIVDAGVPVPDDEPYIKELLAEAEAKQHDVFDRRKTLMAMALQLAAVRTEIESLDAQLVEDVQFAAPDKPSRPTLAMEIVKPQAGTTATTTNGKIANETAQNPVTGGMHLAWFYPDGAFRPFQDDPSNSAFEADRTTRTKRDRIIDPASANNPQAIPGHEDARDDWSTTFGELDDLLSIIRNDMRCLAGLDDAEAMILGPFDPIVSGGLPPSVSFDLFVDMVGEHFGASRRVRERAGLNEEPASAPDSMFPQSHHRPSPGYPPPAPLP